MTPCLFPPPTIPPEAQADLQLGTSAAVLAHNRLGSALTRGEWSAEAAAEIGALISVSKSLHERCNALLLPPGGKR
jgi:hypothetical protein